MAENSASVTSINSLLVAEVYDSLNSLDPENLGRHFLAEAALYSLNDNVHPIEGKLAIVEFFSEFFAKAKNVNFELLSAPQCMGKMVMFEHVDHFDFDGVKHDDHYVSVVLLSDGKIKKWLGYLQTD